MEENKKTKFNKNHELWEPSHSSEKTGFVQVNADTILSRADVGYTLTSSGRPIAVVTHKEDQQVEVKDNHNKYWLINLEQLKGVNFLAFTEELTVSINKFHAYEKSRQSAREFLGGLSVGNQLLNGNEVLATLINITQLSPEHDIILTFEAIDRSRHVVNLDSIPPDQSLNDYLQSFEFALEQSDYSEVDSLLIRYFREEFFDKMLGQMADDHRRNGDTWLSRYENGVEFFIQQRFVEYFNMFEETSKPVPWLKIAGYAILAQARQDHPEWLL